MNFKRNFFLLLLGRFVTNIGDSLYSIAAMWIVFEMTSNTLYTGLAAFLTMLPPALQFLTGPLVDRWDLKRIMVFTQLIEFFLISIIPISHFLGFLNVWIVLAVMPVASFINQFVYPAQSSLLPKILPKELLPKGNSYMTLAAQGTDIIFVGVAGVVIAKIGAISVYMIDAITFLIAAFLFSRMDIDIEREEKQFDSFADNLKGYFGDLKSGYLFIKKSFIPNFIVASVVSNFLIGGVLAALPSYSLLRGGESYYGYYLSALSTGMLLGSLIAPMLKKIKLSHITIIGFLISGVCWILSGLVHSPLFSVILFGVSQITVGITNVLFASTLQTMLSDNIIGRVFSFIVSVVSISTPLGALFGGIIATNIGSSLVFVSGSLGFIFVSVYWMLHPILRGMPRISELNPDIYGMRYEKTESLT